MREKYLRPTIVDPHIVKFSSLTKVGAAVVGYLTKKIISAMSPVAVSMIAPPPYRPQIPQLINPKPMNKLKNFNSLFSYSLH